MVGREAAVQTVFPGPVEDKPQKSPRRRPRGGQCDEHVAESLFWSDAVYAKFYAAHSEEQRVMNSSTSLTGLPHGVARRRAYSSRRLMTCSDQGATSSDAPVGEPTEQQVAKFSELFAALSGGRDWIRPCDAMGLLGEMGVSDPADLLQNFLGEGSVDDAGRRLGFVSAFQLYKEALLPEVVRCAINDAVDGLLEEACYSDDAFVTDRVLPPSGRHPKFGCAHGSVPQWRSKAASLSPRDPFASLARPPPPLSARSQSIFKKCGRFTVSSSFAAT
eukprot:gnl/TRDRNA2_/TRDRNA2_42837_c0_seq2.p1 gnl/TRDRNA2_/TRDRNA2_42837_c0~~gnl/TRDRNA2_/TRDRNA2_42837_c0_seq2.p1  ORF type:complete len:275 (+),score=47.34 gnl/TRDRNA2_/TRDRNA2_42837_c0_seq2:1-825(+)